MAKSPMDIRWAPPPLKPGYTVIDLDKTGDQTYWSFAPDEDVLFIASDNTRTLGRLQTTGGRNIVLIGGKYEPTGPYQEATLKFTRVHGEIWVEGVHIDHKNVSPRDAISVYSADGKQATFTLQNSRIDNVRGVKEMHGDVFQPHGPIGDVRWYNVTGKTDYQGMFIPNVHGIKSVTLDTV